MHCLPCSVERESLAMGVQGRDYMTGGGGASMRGELAMLSVSHKLIIVNAVVFLLWQVPDLGGFLDAHFRVSWAGVFESGRVWTLLTSAFSHQGFWHLFWNMIFLHWLGPDLEQIYGRKNFLVLYLWGAALCSVAHVVYEHTWGRGLPALGASGAVMAVLVTAALFYPHRRILFMFLIPLPLWALVGIRVLGDLMGIVPGGAGGVAHAGHLGGAAAGLLYKTLDLRLFPSPGQEGVRDEGPGVLARLRGLVPTPTRAASAAPTRAEEAPAPPQPSRASVDLEIALRVDELLAKISAEGIGSLSDEERAFLQEASEQYRR